MIREVVVASGKGGTGKTFASSNLAVFLQSELGGGVVCADADVEAPDLILALGGCSEVLEEGEFAGSGLPVVDYEACAKCGACVEACRFGALSMGERGPVVDPDSCEGLGTCAVVCPRGAISMRERVIGRMIVARSGAGLLTVTGDLNVGEGNSGRLVYEIKAKARELAAREGAEYLVVDSAPGIGCPVISSISGADLVLVVAEPTPQSLAGAKRLVEVAECLGVDWRVLVNKWDVNPGFASRIEEEFSPRVVGSVPYDFRVVVSYSKMVPLLLLSPESEASRRLREAFSRLLEVLR